MCAFAFVYTMLPLLIVMYIMKLDVLFLHIDSFCLIAF